MSFSWAEVNKIEDIEIYFVPKVEYKGGAFAGILGKAIIKADLFPVELQDQIKEQLFKIMRENK